MIALLKGGIRKMAIIKSEKRYVIRFLYPRGNSPTKLISNLFPFIDKDVFNENQGHVYEWSGIFVTRRSGLDHAQGRKLSEIDQMGGGHGRSDDVEL